MEAERVYIILGGVPFPARAIEVEVDGDGEFGPRVELAILSESVPGEVRNDPATSSYTAGTRFPCLWTFERHATDKRRMMEPCDERSGDTY